MRNRMNLNGNMRAWDSLVKETADGPFIPKRARRAIIGMSRSSWQPAMSKLKLSWINRRESTAFLGGMRSVVVN